MNDPYLDCLRMAMGEFFRSPDGPIIHPVSIGPG
jgi:hypothetical protein